MKVKSMLIKVGLILALSLVTHFLYASADEQVPKAFFSMSEIENAPEKAMAPLKHTQATDDISLAYRAYLPQKAQAIVIFYHGAGAHSGLTYNHIGAGLSDDFNIAVYMPDIRGHGDSGGARGDASDVKQVWFDINSLVGVARNKYPNLPLFIGGHSAGAGLALNYSSWENRVDVNGYVFLAPYFGFRSETNYDEGESKGVEFSTVTTSDFVINAMSGGLFYGHAKAVKFNFPEALLKSNPEIVPFNTVNMSNAVTPSSPASQLSELQQFGLWIGKNDEAFDPIKVSEFAQNNSDKKAVKQIKMVDNENHFSIIVNAAELMGPWLIRATK